jgi:hypothetical protein
MAFDATEAANLSNLFRSAVTTRLDSGQRGIFESFLQSLLGIRNIRNVQLWTRFGSVQRNFINRNLGQYELDLRTFVASKFVNNLEPNYPVKQKAWLPAIDELAAQSFLKYFDDNYIKEYSSRLYMAGNALVLEYSADSSVNPEEIDLDSPEFEDVLEDEEP